MPNCWDKLRELAASGTGDPGDAAGQIVREFKASASEVDFGTLKQRLEDTLIVGHHTVVPIPHLVQHSRWLAVLGGAVAAARETTGVSVSVGGSTEFGSTARSGAPGQVEHGTTVERDMTVPNTFAQLWAGVDRKIEHAGYFLEQMQHSLERPRNARTARLEAAGAIVDTQWQLSFYANLDAFLAMARSVPEIIQWHFGDDRGHNRNWSLDTR
jgi:hypothetical protein